MAKVKKGNRELTIDEHKVDSFISQGYDQINENGEIVKKGKPVTLNDFKSEYNSLKKENEKLVRKLETLKAENKELKTNLDKLNELIADLENSNTANEKKTSK